MIDYLSIIVHAFIRHMFVMFWPFDMAKNAIQGDALEGSDTF